MEINVNPPVPSQPIEPPETDEEHCDIYEKCLTMLSHATGFMMKGDSSYHLREVIN